jgi:hypothetical protein
MELLLPGPALTLLPAPFTPAGMGMLLVLCKAVLLLLLLLPLALLSTPLRCGWL